MKDLLMHEVWDGYFEIWHQQLLDMTLTRKVACLVTRKKKERKKKQAEPLLDHNIKVSSSKM